MLYSLNGLEPELSATSYVAPTAAVIGEVHLGDLASIWFGAVVRGDTGPLRIGAESNIQDNSVIHTDEGIPFIVGQGVTVGHSCVLHGCIIGDHSLRSTTSRRLNAGTPCTIWAPSSRHFVKRSRRHRTTSAARHHDDVTIVQPSSRVDLVIPVSSLQE